MFQNDELKEHLESSFSVESEPAAIAEWNMNIPGNIQTLGNYRYRKNDTRLNVLPNIFDPNDFGNFYTGATDSDITVESGVEQDGSTPQLFTSRKDKEKLLYSLEDCLKPFRPRSGINKLSYFSNRYLPFSNRDMFLRPRYYMPTKDDEFKYWRSYRTESDLETLFSTPISSFGTIVSVEQDGESWLASISNIASVANLKIGKKIKASDGEAVVLSGTGTIGNIINIQEPVIPPDGIPDSYGIWTGILTGLSSVSGVKVGDTIEANTNTSGSEPYPRIAGKTTKSGTILASGQTQYSISVSSASDLAVGMTIAKDSGDGFLGAEAKIIRITPPRITDPPETPTLITVESKTESVEGSITFTGTATVSVLVIEILSSSSIKYQLTDITPPIAGEVFQIKTVASSFEYSKNNLYISDVSEASGGLVTYTTTFDHNLLAGERVKISQILPIEYNLNDATIQTVPTSNTFTVSSVVSETYVSGGLVEPYTRLSMDVSVQEITGPSSINVRILSENKPKLGSIKDILVKTYRLNKEYGISKNNPTGRYEIEDCNPFVVYKNPIPANRIVAKVQTNIGNINLGPFRTTGSETLADPFFGEQNKTVPKKFRVEYLNPNNQWITAYEFNESSLRDDQVSPIFGPDGYLSLEYGIEIPQDYKNNFVLLETIRSSNFLPEQNFIGRAYLVVPNQNEKGMLYIFNGQTYDEIVPKYRWFVGTDEVYETTHFVTDLTNPQYYNESGEGEETFREFVWIKGVRIAVETMNTPETPLELIEISPRLVANVSKNLIGFSATRALADLASSTLPVGDLIAGTGSVNIFDEDNAFNSNNQWNFNSNTGSIIANHVDRNIKFVFYEVIKNVNFKNDNYYVPIKTMHSEGFQERDPATGEILITLRDFYFYFESLKSPRILLTEVSLSQAVAILLDSVGFSNYVFKRLESENDPVVPYFFIPPDQTIAETLMELSKATQSAMFFDEYNNFVVMTKEYLLDESGDRQEDLVLYGSSLPDNSKLANIKDIATQDKKVYNAGTINYQTRYIRRTGGSIAQNDFTDKKYVYNPSLLWEVAGTETTTSSNSKTQEGFALSAVPLNTDLSSAVPFVNLSGVVINNTFDVGENAYWITRFQGFLYANGEIIKYDAVEYNITGTGSVWISNNLDYQRYFSKLPFNGKIYPTGLVRIYSEPFYQTSTGITVSRNNREIDSVITLKPGEVLAHGRGQFGTPVVSHKAGLDPYWSDNQYIQGCDMDSSLLYTTALYNDRRYPAIIVGAAGVNKLIAEKTQRNSIIRNFLSTRYSTETDVSSYKTAKAGTVQSSALVMTGPDFEESTIPRNFVSYVYKKLDKAYKHFGTRLRIIGKIEATGDRAQTVVGGMTYFNINSTDPSANSSIGGGSAGISLVNPQTNVGYYFEIAALTASSLEDLLEKNENNEATVSIENILFYKVARDKRDTAARPRLAVPIRLWGAIGNILVDDGNFTGQYRFTGEENPTVYDLGLEYVDVSSTRRDFYLYINQKLVATVIDTEPLPLIDPSLGLFIRGTSKAMFENVYALSKNYSDNSVFDTNVPIASVFGDDNGQINSTEALQRYALSGVIQSTYLSGINPTTVPSYDLYFEEFGTIMREASYFNIKYDRAYPALYAKIAPTLNRIKGYTVSGFTADSYGAEFLVFNNTDTLLNLEDKTSNYLRILGITFTQDTTNSITVDDYLKKRGNTSNPEFKGSVVVESPFNFIEQYEKVRESRILYGKNDFTLESIYIQDQDTAENVLEWIIRKNIRPRKSVGINLFSMPILQVGDLVSISYKNSEGIDLVSSEKTKYVIYNINYSRSISGPDMTVYLSEV
jgi:hypothetical protein